MEINPENHIFAYQSNELLNLFETENNLIYSDKCIEVQRSLDPEHLQDIIKYQVNYICLSIHLILRFCNQLHFLILLIHLHIFLKFLFNLPKKN